MPEPRRILVLGGTSDARILANRLADAGVHVISSFAGVTEAPHLPRGEIRTGGFGGAQGLADYLRDHHIAQLIDATHPFAAVMAWHAAEAAAKAEVPLLRLERIPWLPQKGDNWREASSLDQAAAVLPHGARVLLTTGRKGLSAFFARDDLTGVVRMIEAPSEPLPHAWKLIQQRPPYDFAAERALLVREVITHLVVKNSGGKATVAKLAAARDLGLEVVMIQRPAKPRCETFSAVAEVLHRLAGKA